MRISKSIYDLVRYNKINKHITSIEIHVDVLQVLLKADLLKEVKSHPLGYILEEMAEKIEAIKKLHEETYDRLKEVKELLHGDLVKK